MIDDLLRDYHEISAENPVTLHVTVSEAVLVAANIGLIHNPYRDILSVQRMHCWRMLN